jgi:type II secretory pathway component GspD/PulD (secretin)
MTNKKSRSPLVFTSIAAVVLLAGCANVAKYQDEVTDRAKKYSDGPINGATTVRSVERSIPRGIEVEDVDERQAVTISVKNANFYDLVAKLANRLGYGTSALSAVDLQRTVTLDLRGQTIQQAIRQIAWQAGYAIVINETDRTVTVAPEATVVFRVPSEDLKKMLSTQFKYGGSPVSGTSTSSTSSGTGMANGGASINPIGASFAVQGEYVNAPAAFKAFVEKQAGPNTTVEVFAESGLISVRGNGQALKRINDFLTKYSYDARRQIEINARLVEVSLTNEFKYGIQWDKVINAAGTRSVGINTLGTAGTASTSSLSFTTASITSVVKALENFTTVDVSATPKLIVSNNSSGVFFSGTQKPYMPQVTSTTTPSGTGTTTSQSGTGAYAQDGVNLAVHASILDDSNASLTIVPSKVTLGTLQKFLNDQVQMYEQSVQNGGQRISIQSGQTVVISGTRTSTNNSSKQAVPGLVEIPGIGALFAGNTKDVAARESVLIINARILRPAPMNIVFSESI